MTPEDSNIPTPTPPADPPIDETPSWAQQLITQNADFANRLSAFEETLKPIVEPELEPTLGGWTEPKNWQEVETRAEETAQKIVQDTLAERDNQVKAEAEAKAQSEQEVDQYLDAQVEELVKTKRLPTITNDNDPNDPGKLAQRELYGYALSLGTADLKSAYNSLEVLHSANKQFDFVKMELVDKSPNLLGKDSPVGSSNNGNTQTGARPDYKTIHNLSLDALADRFGRNLT